MTHLSLGLDNLRAFELCSIFRWMKLKRKSLPKNLILLRVKYEHTLADGVGGLSPALCSPAGKDSPPPRLDHNGCGVTCHTESSRMPLQEILS